MHILKFTPLHIKNIIYIYSSLNKAHCFKYNYLRTFGFSNLQPLARWNRLANGYNKIEQKNNFSTASIPQPL